MIQIYLSVIQLIYKQRAMQSQQDKNEEEVQKKQQQLIYKISYVDDPDALQPKKYKYSNDTLFPFLFFYKLLALKPCDRTHRYSLTLNIPDTIVFNDGDNPIMWFYTNEKGQVVRMDNVPFYQITNKLCEGAFDKQLVAVLKKPSYSGYGGPSGNQIKVVSASQVKTVISLVLSSRNQISVIQKFVKSGSVKPSIVRTCWRASGPHQSWTINSNFQYTSKAKVPEISKFIVNTKFTKGFRATKNLSQKFTNQTLKYVKNIVQFVSRHLKIKFLEFVCDFIKDQAGNWWFINVKAFVLQNQQKINIRPITMHDDDAQEEEKTKKNLESYTKCKKCKYCYKVIAEHLMTHKLTLMMILQCDQNLIRMGKNFPWLDRCYRHHVNSVNLYVQYKVCDSCYKLYTEVQKIMELSQKMAKMTGVNIKSDNKNLVSITGIPAFKGQSPQFGSRFQKLKYDKQMPENWSLPTDQKIRVGLEGERNYTVNRCKFMIFVHGLRDIPKNFENSSKKYYLHYSFLDIEVRYQLNLNFTEQFEDMLRLKLDKMKLIYFFSQSRDDIVKFLKNQEKLKISLYEENQLMGSLDLQLNDFKSDKVIKKDYYKMFSGPKVFPYLSWGLFISLGLHEDAKIDTKSLKLVRKNSLLIPEVGYNCPDLLPQQWVQMINDKPDSLKTMISLPSQSGDVSSYQTNSEIQIKRKMDREMSSYSRRIFSQHKAKRKVYY